MPNFFNDFKDWHPAFDHSQAVLATIDDRFDENQHRQVAGLVLKTFAKENGDEHANDTEIQQMLHDGSKEKVKDHVNEAFTKYGRQLDAIISGSFEDLWRDTPTRARGDLYTFVSRFKPIDNPVGLSPEFARAHKQHKFLAKLGGKINEYRTQSTPESRRKELDIEFYDMLCEEYDKMYLDTPEKTTRNQGLVDVMKKWAKKSPKMVLSRFMEKQEKALEKFETDVKLADVKPYMQAVYDTEGLRKLYGTAIAHYTQSEEERKVREKVDVLRN